MRDHIREARRILMLNGMLGPQAACVLRHPGAFALRTLRAFRANQALLLARAIAVPPSLELAATLLPLGAQVIAEYERPGSPRANAEPEPMRLGAD